MTTRIPGFWDFPTAMHTAWKQTFLTQICHVLNSFEYWLFVYNKDNTSKIIKIEEIAASNISNHFSFWVVNSTFTFYRDIPLTNILKYFKCMCISVVICKYLVNMKQHENKDIVSVVNHSFYLCVLSLKHLKNIIGAKKQS